MSLETHFLTKQLQKYMINYNKIDKNFATVLYDAVDVISQFLQDVEIQENDETSDVFDIIPTIDNDICQAHRNYYCKACNLSVKASAKQFKGHFYGNKHLKSLREVSQKMDVKGRPMTAAPLDRKGSTQSLDAASPAKNPKFAKKERLNSLPAAKVQDIKLPKKFCDFISNGDLEDYTVKLLSDGAKIKHSDHYKRVCVLLERRLSGRFPHVRAYPFGSVVLGLGHYQGDLDVFVDIGGDCYFKKPGKRMMKDAIHQTQRILMQYRAEWEGFEPVTKARTPILRVVSRREKLDCDLSFSNGLSCCNTALIQHFIELQPVCKKLAIFVKFWSHELHLGLNSYLLSLLVIFYLQQEELLPSVASLQEGTPPVLVDGWRANFLPKTLLELKIEMSTDFKKYLIGFYRFYGFDFDYENSVVSILTGSPVNKTLFDHGKEGDLPVVFERYKIYMTNIDLEEADEVEDLFSNHKPLVIQDPFELCHNVRFKNSFYSQRKIH